MIEIDDIKDKLLNTIKYKDLIIMINRLELIYKLDLTIYINQLNQLSNNKDSINKLLRGRERNIQLFYIEKQRKTIINQILILIPKYKKAFS